MKNITFSIAICDDNIHDIDYIKSICEKYIKLLYDNISYHFITFSSGAELDHYNGDIIDLLFLDIDLPDSNGIVLKDHVLNSKLFTYIVFNSGYDSYMEQAFSIKTLGFLTKPAPVDRIKDFIDYVLEKKKQISSYDLMTIIKTPGCTPMIFAILRLIQITVSFIQKQIDLQLLLH